ncbi:hypothetical protein J6590_001700 [Homalodisca vitripennis]|nr:hypothetical protein J6590_001700 [Homalodisca vitripennis]
MGSFVLQRGPYLSKIGAVARCQGDLAERRPSSVPALCRRHHRTKTTLTNNTMLDFDPMNSTATLT